MQRLIKGAPWALALVALAGFSAQPAGLVGAGATFPAPLYEKWIASFQARFPGTGIRYEAIGSEQGVRRLQQGEVDFAAADFPVSDERLGAEHACWHLATVVGAVVPVYNIPGFVRDLRLSREAAAGIFLGKIKRWNDPLLRACNRGVKLPDSEIKVVHRADGSGTTFVWSDYLSKVSAEWESQVGRGSSLKWPAGEAAEGNEGVAARVQQTPNSIGYVEFIYAVRKQLPVLALENAAGRFVEASIASIRAAAASSPEGTNEFRISITNAQGPEAYPAASFTWFVIPRHVQAAEKRAELQRFLTWALSSGQNEAAGLGYVSLPKNVLAREQAVVSSASFLQGSSQ